MCFYWPRGLTPSFIIKKDAVWPVRWIFAYFNKHVFMLHLEVWKEPALGVRVLLHLTACLLHYLASTPRNLVCFHGAWTARFSKRFLVSKAYRCISAVAYGLKMQGKWALPEVYEDFWGILVIYQHVFSRGLLCTLNSGVWAFSLQTCLCWPNCSRVPGCWLSPRQPPLCCPAPS